MAPGARVDNKAEDKRVRDRPHTGASGPAPGGRPLAAAAPAGSPCAPRALSPSQSRPPLPPSACSSWWFSFRRSHSPPFVNQTSRADPICTRAKSSNRRKEAPQATREVVCRRVRPAACAPRTKAPGRHKRVDRAPTSTCTRARARAGREEQRRGGTREPEGKRRGRLVGLRPSLSLAPRSPARPRENEPRPRRLARAPRSAGRKGASRRLPQHSEREREAGVEGGASSSRARSLSRLRRHGGQAARRGAPAAARGRPAAARQQQVRRARHDRRGRLRHGAARAPPRHGRDRRHQAHPRV